ncbi:hypothetical protein JD844_029085 [Phrynosoma platyrhinos]|uniref:Kielin/chordin-like protein n=1 Tax=Phrynosoma platyrhinos TaxID=52577 RepID=A0ABQ7SIS1_PHRPL|nr:hypothetical protein JD844_029085 [Phrynosoma platyrhinos]
MKTKAITLMRNTKQKMGAAITLAKGPDPGVPTWKFRQRVPHLTLPWDYSVYLLSTVQGALGFHFVARQSRGSEGTLISLVSPAALKRDGRPLLQLVSNTQADELRLEYRAVHNMEPARLVFPTSNPFSHSRWVRLALNLEPPRISLFVDCREPFVFEKGGGEDVLSLILPLDLQITFASILGDKTSKFLGLDIRCREQTQLGQMFPIVAGWDPLALDWIQVTFWDLGCLATPETAQKKRRRRGGNRKPDLLPMSYTIPAERYRDLPEEHLPELDSPPHFEPLALTDIRHYQREPSESDFPPPGSSLRPDPTSPEERIRRLEELVHGLGTMLDMVKEQNSDLLVRVKSLEDCECRPLLCFWEGQRYEDGASWEKDPCTTCTCIRGKTECSLRHDRPRCLGAWSGATPSSALRSAVPRLFPNLGTVALSAQGGKVFCQMEDCAPAPCRHPAIPQGKCCPECRACLYDGRLLADGQSYLDGVCTRCVCQAGTVQCQTTKCSELSCRERYTPSGECCPICRPVCELDGRSLEPGQEVTSADGCQRCSCSVIPSGGEMAGSSLCERCACKDGNVVCAKVPCPKLECAATEEVPGQCCHRCQVCEFEGHLHPNGETFTPSGERPCLQCTCAVSSVASDCTHENRVVPDGEEIHNPLNPCQACVCAGGELRCKERPCPGASCAHPLPGSCCQNNCNGCSFQGHEYKDGETFVSPNKPCEECRCLGGTVTCLPLPCPPISCKNPITPPGQCCPKCTGTCRYHGRLYKSGEAFSSPQDACHTCTCQSGETSCEAVPCEETLCSHPAPGPGQCCPLCHDCLFEGERYAHGEAFKPESCLQCTCQDGNVRCEMIQCPPTLCSHPVTEPGVCCPRCKDCIYDGRVYSPGESFQPGKDPCEVCTCELGHIECHIQECLPIVCQDGLVKVQVPGQCCAECQDPGASCSHQGQTFQSHEHWQVDECTTCTCLSGEVHCRSERCPPTACASDETPALIPGMCCPHCVSRPATCVAFGDPHYRTFDGRMVHFQGSCTYVMAQDCDGGDFR